jgi:hypothetical protein
LGTFHSLAQINTTAELINKAMVSPVLRILAHIAYRMSFMVVSADIVCMCTSQKILMYSSLVIIEAAIGMCSNNAA